MGDRSTLVGVLRQQPHIGPLSFNGSESRREVAKEEDPKNADIIGYTFKVPLFFFLNERFGITQRYTCTI